jgi:hypothetical protein
MPNLKNGFIRIKINKEKIFNRISGKVLFSNYKRKWIEEKALRGFKSNNIK